MDIHERTVRVFVRIMERIERAASEADAIVGTLESILETFDWIYGGYWEASEDGGVGLVEDAGLEHGAYVQATRKVIFHHGRGLIGQVHTKGRTDFWVDLPEREGFLRAKAAGDAGIQCAIALPVFERGEVIGVVDFCAPENLELSRETVVAFENAIKLLGQTLGQLRRAKEEREARVDAETVTSALERMRGLETGREASLEMIHIVNEAFGWAFASVYRMDARGKIRCVFTEGTAHDTFVAATQKTSFDPGQGLVGHAWSSQEIQFVEDLQTLPGYLRADAARLSGVHSGVTIPVTDSAGQTLLVVDFCANERVCLSQSRRKALTSLASVCTGVIERVAEKRRAEHRMQREFGALVDAIESVAGGRLPDPPPPARTPLAKRLEMAVHELIDTQQLVITQAAKMADGDLRVDWTTRNDDDLFFETLGRLSESLGKAVTDIRESCDETLLATNHLTEVSQRLAFEATRTAHASNELTQVSEQLEAEASVNNQATVRVSEASGEARRVLDEGQRTMRELRARMVEMSESSYKISGIVGTIDDIAFQTRLLSLNASVKAARVGVHGQGFAVVAEEVRNLAERSARAAAETSSLLEQVTSSIEHSGGAVRRAHEQFEHIGASFDEVTTNMDALSTHAQQAMELTATMSEQLGYVDDSVSENTAASEELASSAEQLSLMSRQTVALLEHFDVPEDAIAPHGKDLEALFDAFMQSMATHH